MLAPECEYSTNSRLIFCGTGMLNDFVGKRAYVFDFSSVLTLHDKRVKGASRTLVLARAPRSAARGVSLTPQGAASSLLRGPA
jgi:hypothetical protein